MYQYKSENKEKFDITITASPLDSHSDPDIFVSFTNHHPTETDNDYADISYGFDMVVIPYDSIGQDDRTIYLAVQCQSKSCNFELQAMKTEKFRISID